MLCRILRHASVLAILAVAGNAFAVSSPHCLEGQKGSLYVIYKDAERYERKIKGALLKGSCERAKELEAAAIALPLESSFAAKMISELTPEQNKYLEQVKNGANELRSENSAEEFLRNHPVAAFTKETNRDFTQRFGEGFAGELFQAWLESHPQNQKAKALVFENMKQTLADPSSRERLSKKFEGTVVLVSMGLDWSDEIKDKSPWYLKNFVSDMKDLGVNASFVKRNALGTVAENVRALIPQVRAALEQNQRVILMGLCKGTPEVLMALSRVLAEKPELESRFVGILNLSGMMGPIYFADNFEWLTSVKTLQKLLEDVPVEKMRAYAGYDHAMKSMTTPAMAPVTQAICATLPKNATYLNVTGILRGNGLLKTDTTAMGPFYKMNRKLHLAKGANDGFLEYPDNTIPDGLAPKNYTVVVNGSHMLTDGDLGSYSLLDAKNRVAAYRALLKTLIDLSEGR